MKKKILKWLIIALVLFSLFFLLFLIFTLPQVPEDISQLSLTNPTSFYADNGELITSLTDRQMVQISQISEYFRKAIVAVEDDGFYSHHGISKRGLLRALLRDLRHLRIVEGGSSITQQVAKNLFLTFDQNFSRKFKEMLLAIQIEQQFSKEEILQAYCNQICFGPGIYGVENAAQTYLGKHADELNLAESAFLANLPRSPSNYNPYKNFELAKKRQEIVLNRMVAVNFISEEEKTAALAQQLNLRNLNLMWGKSNYFISYARSLVAERFGRNVVDYGGVKIYTTLDARLQTVANEAVKTGLARLDKLLGLADYQKATLAEQQNYPQAALVAIEPKTGKVKALVGGRDFGSSEFNRAVQNNRLPGSSFKPVIYLTAIDKGLYHPATIVEDTPVKFGKGKNAWQPQNYDHKYDGKMILKRGLMESKNVVAAKLIADVGPDKVVETAKKLGIISKLEPDLSLSLGTYGISPLEMAAAYSVFANEGIYFQPSVVKLVENNVGRPLLENRVRSKRVFDAQTIYLLVDMMTGVLEDGTAKSARAFGFDRRAAGKTGTTNDYRDAWFIGFTPQLVTAVWVGFDDNRPLRTANGAGITGASGALPIWIAFMNAALRGQRYQEFPIPPGIIFENVDERTGEVVTSTTDAFLRVALRYGTSH
ncbi:PBP1A family penicillin-binding protein [candidate division KSB1 bacterium]|nr:PBP1A family penicillin-binding protein [candidate division KSB1 bacterium]